MTVSEMIALLQRVPPPMRHEPVYIEIETGLIAPIVTVEYNPSFGRVVAQIAPPP